jgi:hypothetical protein
MTKGKGFKMKKLAWLLSLALLTGCDTMPLNPGHARTTTGGITTQVDQSQNPAAPTTQIVEETVTTERPSQTSVTNAEKITTIRKVQTTIGAAQKDTAREMAAKLSSFKGIQWLGALVFLFGVASAFYPPLKIVVGDSVTTSAAIAGAGLALCILPTLIVGHEIFILTVCIGVAGAWFLAHRHGQLRGRLDANHDQMDSKIADLVNQMQSAGASQISGLIAEGEKIPGGGPALKAAAAQRLQQLQTQKPPASS